MTDILSELTRQLEPLEKQSETARVYLSKRETLKELDVNMFLMEYAAAAKELKELEEKRTAMMSDISEELQKRKEAMAGKVSHNMQRFVKAYPNLNRGYKLHKKYGFGRKNKDAE